MGRGEATKVARLAEAGGCRAVEANKSRDGPKPGAAVQRERHESRNGAELAVEQRARRGRRRSCAQPLRGLRRCSVFALR